MPASAFQSAHASAFAGLGGAVAGLHGAVGEVDACARRGIPDVALTRGVRRGPGQPIFSHESLRVVSSSARSRCTRVGADSAAVSQVLVSANWPG